MKQALKLTTILATALIASSAYADGSNNEINLELIGDDLKPSVTQDGSYNKAAMKLKNTTDDTKIVQKGNRNEASMQLNTGVEFSGFSGAVRGAVTINQTGDDNTAKITDGGGTIYYYPLSRLIGDQTVDQSGNGNTLEASVNSVFPVGQYLTPEGNRYIQQGNNNSLKITNAGIGDVSSVTGNRLYQQIGNGNTAQFNSDFLQNEGFKQEGEYNTAIITGSASIIQQSGSNNQITAFARPGRYPMATFIQKGDGNAIAGAHTAEDTGAYISQNGQFNQVSGTTSRTFIQQVGERNDSAADMNRITLTQNGVGNRVTGKVESVSMQANGITQTGKFNSTHIEGYFGDVQSYSTLSQKGQKNEYSLFKNNPNNVTYLQQDGNENKASQTISGQSNILGITQTGDSNSATQSVDGATNMLTIAQNGVSNVASQNFVGDLNRSAISQTGSNHTAALDITGNNNNLNVTQEGVGQKFSLNRVGNGMTLNIVQK